MTNASRNSQVNFIDFLDRITCSSAYTNGDSCSAWFTAIVKDRADPMPCLPFLVVSRNLPIERDGWQRKEVFDEERNALKFETDVYYTYTLTAYGDDAENLLSDLQQMFLRHDVRQLHFDMVGGNLIRASNVLPTTKQLDSTYVPSAYMTVRLGFVDTTYEEAIDCADLTGTTSYINEVTDFDITYKQNGE